MVCGIVITIIHEGGHYLVAWKLGLQPVFFRIGVGPVIIKKGIFEITCFPASGMVQYEDDDWLGLSQLKKKYIAVGGPGINLVFGLATIYWLPVFGLVNLMVAAGNLIPIQASRGLSDGGYVFQDKSKLVYIPISLLLGIIAITCFLSALSMLF